MSVTNNATYGGDVLYFPCGIYKIANNTVAESLTNLPIAAAGILQILSISSHNNDLSTYTYVYRTYIFIPIGKRDIYIRNISTGSIANVFTVDTGWKKVCTTSVADVPKTTLTLDTNVFSSGTVYYEVRNGICFVSIIKLIPKNSGVNLPISTSLPKSNCYILQPLNVGNVDTIPTQPIAARIGEGETTLYIHSINNTRSMYGSFSYPVAES